MKKLFGTDGIRGTANTYPMTAEVAIKIGMACSRVFNRGDHRHRVVIGKDTRLSGYMLEPALTAGFTSMGMDVITIGPVPTPAVGILTKSMRCDIGVMISASHNPFYDNGIKLFGPDGFKLDTKIEKKIEDEIHKDLSKFYALPKHLGRTWRLEDAKGRYMEIAKKSIDDLSLEGLRVVLDCANGAAYKVATTILWELGCDVITIGNEPNGFNINQGCGSTHPELITQKVIEYRADLGIALDGDADRIIVSDENGDLIDGDKIMGLIAINLKNKDKLKGGGLVSTIMSNMALEKYLNKHGLNLIRTDVGDKYVVEHMRKNNFNVGGEQSGHIVLSDITTTGDGIIAGLQILSLLKEKKEKASKLFDIYTPFPQKLENFKFLKDPLNNKEVKSAITKVEKELGDKGRIIIRKSGTEPLIRVMIEAEEQDLVDKYHNYLKPIINNAI